MFIVASGMTLNSFAQLFLLPTPFYLAEVWFPLEKRSLVIGIAFYSNLLEFGLGGTLSSLIGYYNIVTVSNILLSIAAASTISFLIAVVIVRNKPKIKI